VTLSLEDQSLNLRRRISELEEQLKDVDARLHKKRVRECGLTGRKAFSARVPLGILVDDVTFHTWSPDPQSVSGYRLGGSGAYTTIHLTSPGFQFHEPDPASLQPQ